MIQIEREKLEKVLDALKANDILVNGTETSGGLVFCLDGYYSDCFDVDPVNKQTEEAIIIIKDVLAQKDSESATYQSYGLMGGDEFVNRDSLNRNIT